MIENTSNRDALLHLAGMMGGQDRYITEMESAGQRELVHSDRLPTEANPSDADFEAVGFTFGAVDPGDDLFRPATLPGGWKREGSDHAMWSYILDRHGRRRVSVFYKAAFYDRRAFMRLDTPAGYLHNVLYDNRTPVLDDEWLTREVVVRELEQIRDSELREAEQSDEYAAETGRDNTAFWTKRASEHRAEAAKANRMIEAIAP